MDRRQLLEGGGGGKKDWGGRQLGNGEPHDLSRSNANENSEARTQDSQLAHSTTQKNPVEEKRKRRQLGVPSRRSVAGTRSEGKKEAVTSELPARTAFPKVAASGVARQNTDRYATLDESNLLRCH
ncbi:hypothetical protein TNIN_186841 [Trichonephila inaurata madagascariensis]|uniref:Uncharacterized protein n=1 Tax=Trichonephila inaurata madagascariensis TaxID=2747483 RepID=A0A8X6XQ54_9ARAC|nr:hypothetical protein TNIN_186841 [Trichonephila inaurata madagascariensis]